MPSVLIWGRHRFARRKCVKKRRGAHDASVMGRKRSLRVRKWNHPGGRGWGHAAARWGGWRIPEMNRISTFRAALVALSMVAFSGAALAQSPAPSAHRPRVHARLACPKPVGRAQPRPFGGTGATTGRNQVAGGYPHGRKGPGARAAAARRQRPDRRPLRRGIHARAEESGCRSRAPPTGMRRSTP